MAESFTLTGNLKLDPRSINQSARQVKQALGRITGQASEFQKSLDASTARVFAFGATTLVLNGVSQAFRNLVQSTIEVEARLTEINAIFQQSESVMNSFRETIFDVAQETGQTFSTVADAAAELARQGLSAEETAQRLQAALILTRISGLGAEDSVKTLTAAINGFTSAALSAEEVTSKIVAVDTAFAVSAQDLAQGLARAGSTAEDAGVSFDQLLGLITAVEQRTARGGAVIGNAFKSIFTRLSRGTTIDDLQALGVEIDATQTGVQKLQALSTAIEGIGDPTVVSKIKELAGGVFQINVVSAALKDLSSETSVFKKATVEAANASDNAFKRNAELNKSLSAQINSLTVGLTNLAEKIGGVTFGPLLENLVSIADKITDVFNKALDPEKGSAIIKGFIKGIGLFLSGPGLVIITGAFLKIVKLVGKFAVDGFKSLQQIGSASEKIKQVEGGIVALLGQDEKLRKAIGSTTLTQAQKEEAVIKAIKRENALLNEQRQLLQSITALTIKRGFSQYSPSGGFKKSGRAAGYIPNFAVQNQFETEESQARLLGATKSVKAKYGKGTIGGRRFVMNDQETEIPNFGRNGDSAVIPNYSRGFVPNFAKDPIEEYTLSEAKFLEKYFKNGKYTGSGNSIKKYANKTDQALIAELPKDKKTGKVDPNLLKIAKDRRTTANKVEKIKKERVEAKKFTLKPVNLQKLNKGSRLPSVLTPKEKSGFLKTSTQKTDSFRPIDYSFPIRGVKEDTRNKLGENFDKQFDAKKIEEKALSNALNQTNSILSVLGDPKIGISKIKKTDKVKGFVGAVRAGAGAIFDAAITTALNVKASPEGDGGDFDVDGAVTGLSKLFGQKPVPSSGLFAGKGDFKFSAAAKDSMKQKTLTELRGKNPDIYEKLKIPTRLKGRASGYIPNFASDGILGDLKKGGKDKNESESEKEKKTKSFKNFFARGYIPNFASREKVANLDVGGALGDAIQREKDAGLPKSKIRVEQSSRLANRDNPSGLAVTNTRDEPRGLRDVFASGYVPNFAEKRTNVPLKAETVILNSKTVKRTDSGSKLAGKASENLRNNLNEASTAALSNAGANRSASGSVSSSSKNLGASIKGVASKFDNIGTNIAVFTALSFASQKATEAGNKVREKEVELIGKSFEKRKEALTKQAEEDKEGKSEKKQKEIDDTLSIDIQELNDEFDKLSSKIRESTTLYEKVTSGLQGTLLTLSSLSTLITNVDFSGWTTKSKSAFSALAKNIPSKSLSAFKATTITLTSTLYGAIPAILAFVASLGKSAAGGIGDLLGRRGKGLKGAKGLLQRAGSSVKKARGAGAAAKALKAAQASKKAAQAAGVAARAGAAKAAGGVAAKVGGGAAAKVAGGAAAKVGGGLAAGGGAALLGTVLAGLGTGAALGTTAVAKDANPVAALFGDDQRGEQLEKVEQQIIKSRRLAYLASNKISESYVSENASLQTVGRFGKQIEKARKEYVKKYTEAAGSVEVGGFQDGTVRGKANEFLKTNSVSKALGLDNLASVDGKVDDEDAQAKAKEEFEVLLKKYEKANDIQNAINASREQAASVLGRISTQNSIIEQNTAKEADIQKRIILTRQNALADLNRAGSLLSKETLASGGKERLSFGREKLKISNSETDFNEASANKQRTQFRLNNLNDINNRGEGGEDISKQIEEATKANNDARSKLTESQNAYQNAIKNGAVQMQSDLLSLGEKIKSSGDDSIKKAFQEVEKIQASQLTKTPKEREAGAGKLEAAAAKVSDAIGLFAQRQEKENAAAASQTFGNISAAISADGGGNIELAIEKYKAGIQALQDPNITNQKRLEISGKVTAARDTIEGNLGTGAIDIINKQLGKTQDQVKEIQLKGIKLWAKNLEGFSKEDQKGIVESVESKGDASGPNKDVEGNAKQQQDLLDTYLQLNTQLNIFLEDTKNVNGANILKKAQELEIALGNAAKGPQELADSLTNLSSFGEGANKEILLAQKNIAKIRRSSETAESAITTLNQSLVEITTTLTSRIKSLEDIVKE